MFYRRDGQGEPLLLLHGFGLSHFTWTPVVPLLTPHREVLLVDLPGHGRTPMPPPGVPPSPAGYATVIGRLLDELGLDRVDVAGNSIGGWTAFELARAGRARSVVALSPAGLWAGRESVKRMLFFLADQAGARLAGPALVPLLRNPAGRDLLLRSTMANPRDLSAEDAVTLIRTYAGTQQMAAHIRARRGRGFTGGRDLDIPITVAWGAEDRFIPRSARRRDLLPAHTRWLDLPGCGHVMMWDDPDQVAKTILDGVE